MPLTTITAWEALFDRMGVDRLESRLPGDAKTLLVIGGAGGVGSIAIQLAKTVAGLRVVATASRPESAAWCHALGADAIIDHHEPFLDQFTRAGLSEADYIFCLNSTEAHIQNMADVIKPQGKLCLIVEAKGPVNINPLQRKSVALCWELMFTRSLFQTSDMQAQHDLLNEAADLFDAGVLRTTMTRNVGVLDAAHLKQAHADIERGDTIGKLTLSV